MHIFIYFLLLNFNAEESKINKGIATVGYGLLIIFCNGNYGVTQQSKVAKTKIIFCIGYKFL